MINEILINENEKIIIVITLNDKNQIIARPVNNLSKEELITYLQKLIIDNQLNNN